MVGCTSPQLAFFMIFDDFAALLNERERGPEKGEKYVGYETDFLYFFHTSYKVLVCATEVMYNN